LLAWCGQTAPTGERFSNLPVNAGLFHRGFGLYHDRLIAPFVTFNLPLNILKSNNQETSRMIFVLATIQSVPGRREDLLAEFRQIVETVRAEKGCIEYGPAVDTKTDIGAQTTNADAFTVVEKWQSLADLQVHLDAPHMHEYRAKTSELVESVELKILEPC